MDKLGRRRTIAGARAVMVIAVLRPATVLKETPTPTRATPGIRN